MQAVVDKKALAEEHMEHVSFTYAGTPDWQNSPQSGSAWKRGCAVFLKALPVANHKASCCHIESLRLLEGSYWALHNLWSGHRGRRNDGRWMTSFVKFVNYSEFCLSPRSPRNKGEASSLHSLFCHFLRHRSIFMVCKCRFFEGSVSAAYEKYTSSNCVIQPRVVLSVELPTVPSTQERPLSHYRQLPADWCLYPLQGV